jgi:hypothetical protein
MGQVPLPGDFEDVEFRIEKEDWNTYELKDDVKIKGRIIVLRLNHDRNMPPGQYGLQSQNIFVVYAPSRLRGPPSTPPIPENIKESDMYSVEAITSNEVWNTYHILNSGDRIKVKLVATDIFRVKDAYDQFGQPYYIVTSGVMITPISKGIKS